MKRNPAQYRTYAVRTPKRHTRQATCEEVGCLAYLNGWAIAFAMCTEKDHFAIKHSGRRYRIEELQGELCYVFEEGQPCFKVAEHRVLVVPPMFYAGQGIWRGRTPKTLAPHTRPEFWVEDFAENQSTLAELQERG